MKKLKRVSILALSIILSSWLSTVAHANPVLQKASPHYSKKYNFSTNWFTWNIPLWKTVLKDLRGKPNLHYLEIGVFEGRSAIWMMENILTHPSSEMTCIDIFPGDLKERFLANVKIAGALEKTIVIQSASQIALRTLPVHSFDIVYIDGSHIARDVLTDAILSWELLKTGGILIFDDYDWKESLPIASKPRVAVDTFAIFFGEDAELIHRRYQVIFRKLDVSYERHKKITFSHNYFFVLRILNYYRQEVLLISLSGLLLLLGALYILSGIRRHQ